MHSQIERYTDAHLRRIYYFALKKTGNPSEAEELAARINLAIIDRLAHGDEPKNFTAWVNAIARNVWSRQAREYVSRRETTLNADISEVDIASEQSVEQLAEASETLAIMRRELAFLSREYREITVAYYIDDRRLSDIAAELKIPLGSAKRKLFESRKLLREGMKMSREFGPKSYRPENVRFTYAASREGWPPEDVVKRKIPKNLLLEASENPSTAEELAIALGIALPYLEEEIELLVKSDLLKKVGNKYTTNFFIADVDTQNKVYAMLDEDAPERNAMAKQIALDMLPALRGAADFPTDFTDSDLLWYAIPNLPRRLQILATNKLTRHPYMLAHPDGTKWFISGFLENATRDFMRDENGEMIPVINGMSGLIWDYEDSNQFNYNNFPFNDINHDVNEITATISDGRAEELFPSIIVFRDGASIGYYVKMAAHPLMQRLTDMYMGYYDKAAEIIASCTGTIAREQTDLVAQHLISCSHSLIALPMVQSAFEDGTLQTPSAGKRVAMWFELGIPSYMEHFDDAEKRAAEAEASAETAKGAADISMDFTVG